MFLRISHHETFARVPGQTLSPFQSCIVHSLFFSCFGFRLYHYLCMSVIFIVNWKVFVDKGLPFHLLLPPGPYVVPYPGLGVPSVLSRSINGPE